MNNIPEALVILLSVPVTALLKYSMPILGGQMLRTLVGTSQLRHNSKSDIDDSVQTLSQIFFPLGTIRCPELGHLAIG